MQAHIQMFFSFGLYVLTLFTIGLIAYRAYRSKSAQADSADFLVGSRSLNYWVTALSAHGSDMSDWLFMGYPAMLYSFGMIQAWVAISLLLFMFLNWQFIAPRLRKQTETLNTVTLSGFLEKKTEDTSRAIRIVCALFSLFFYTMYMSAGLYGMGLVFEAAFGIRYDLGVVISAVIVGLYALGGFFAAAWVELFQALFLLVVIVFVPLVAALKIGGLPAIKAAAHAKNVSLALVPDWSFKTLTDIILITLGWGLGYFGMPHIQAKFLGIKNPEELNKAKYVGSMWQFLTLAAAVSIGIVGIAYFANPLDKPELVFIEMVKSLFNPFVAGFMLCAIFAAGIAVMNAQMLVIGSVVTDDFYKRVIHPTASRAQLMRVYQLTIFAAALISTIITLITTSTIYNLVWYAWTGLGCTFGPLVIMTLYSKRVYPSAALAGIITGGVLAALWKPVLNPVITTYQIPGMIPGFAASLLAIWFVNCFNSPSKN